MPTRNFTDLDEFKEEIGLESERIIDGVKHSTQRPKGYEKQKELYSGKKALGGIPHTHKELIISSKSRKISYISKIYKGKEQHRRSE